MKTKHFLFLIIVLPLLLGTVGCDKPEKENEVPKELVGIWVLAGFGNEADKSFKESKQPPNCVGCINLQVKEDNTLAGRTLLNYSAWTSFSIVEDIIFSIKDIIWTEVGEIDGGDGYLFISTLSKVSHFSVGFNQLKLFYSNTEYMLFNRKDAEL